MTALSIVEHLHVLEDVLCRVFTARVVSMVHELALECPEEAFDTGIVPTVAGAAHAGRDAVGGEYVLVLRGGLLAAAIRVVQQPCLGRAMVDRHRKRLLCEIDRKPGAHGPADHGA